jgi:predicted acylesterase/phospholipase RssA
MATPSVRDLERLARAALTFTGLLSLDIHALLDTTPSKATLQRAIPFERIGEHVAQGRLKAAAVIATSALTGRSVVFHQGGTPDEARDDKRGIDYVPAVLSEEHVRASSAIPAAFPAVEIHEGPGAGWYFDGGIRRTIPYIFIAPPGRDTIGAIARDVFRRHYRGLIHAHRSPQLALLGRLVDAGADPLHGELLSYLFFAPEFAHALIARGREDAESWLAEPHDDGLWDTGPLARSLR